MSCVTVRKVGNGYFITPGDDGAARHSLRSNDECFVAESREKCSTIVHQLLEGVSPTKAAQPVIDTAGRDDGLGGAPYGWCPYCCARGDTRERCPNGNDTCARGHVYKSTEALKSPVNFVPRVDGPRNG